ncbi:MAG: alpha/beta hydrolase [Verrucomicrobiae bacterium]|nr:alpha/beta hydrolase [Verrucomicrobiae bacterium]
MSYPFLRCLVVATIWLCAWAVAIAHSSAHASAERVRLPVPAHTAVAAGEDKENDPTVPTVDVYLPAKEKACGTAVVVLPGGGYGTLALDHEGKQIAGFFIRHGIAAFVTRYRHAPRYRHPIPMQDAQCAMRFVRANAARFGVRPDRIGVMGFSAGGHLAATVSTKFETVDGVPSRPDFAILCYPVISFVEFTHAGSRKNLLGDNPPMELLRELSAELQVTAKTPPTFLFHTDEDKSVPAVNSVLYYLALRRHNVPAELHIYRHGRHGVGLAAGDPRLCTWSTLLLNWLDGLGLLAPAE